MSTGLRCGCEMAAISSFRFGLRRTHTCSRLIHFPSQRLTLRELDSRHFPQEADYAESLVDKASGNGIETMKD